MSACMPDRPDMFAPTRGQPGGPTLVAMATTFALGAESKRLPACLSVCLCKWLTPDEEDQYIQSYTDFNVITNMRSLITVIRLRIDKVFGFGKSDNNNNNNNNNNKVQQQQAQEQNVKQQRSLGTPSDSSTATKHCFAS